MAHGLRRGGVDPVGPVLPRVAVADELEVAADPEPGGAGTHRLPALLHTVLSEQPGNSKM